MHTHAHTHIVRTDSILHPSLLSGLSPFSILLCCQDCLHSPSFSAVFRTVSIFHPSLLSGLSPSSILLCCLCGGLYFPTGQYVCIVLYCPSSTVCLCECLQFLVKDSLFTLQVHNMAQFCQSLSCCLSVSPLHHSVCLVTLWFCHDMVVFLSVLSHYCHDMVVSFSVLSLFFFMTWLYLCLSYHIMVSS